MSIMVGYQYTPVQPKVSIFNRMRISKKAIAIIAAIVILVGAALLAYYVVPQIIMDYRMAHLYDNVNNEKAAITQVVISELSGIPYKLEELPAKVELLQVYPDHISVWSENLFYYGDPRNFSPYKIELRESIYD